MVDTHALLKLVGIFLIVVVALWLKRPLWQAFLLGMLGIVLLYGVTPLRSGIISLAAPMAFLAIPNGGVPLMVLLMTMSHIASLVSPTHVCVTIVADYYKIGIGGIVQRALPVMGVFFAFMLAYYPLMMWLMP